MELRQCVYRRVLVGLCFLLLGQIMPTQLLWNVISESTTTGVETSMNSAAGRPSYFGLSTGATYIFQLDAQPASVDGPTAYFFSPGTGAPLSMGISSSSGLSSVSASAVTEVKRMYLGGEGGDGVLQRHIMSFSTLTNQYSLSSWGRPWLLSSVQKLIVDANTNYLFLLQSSSSSLFKWDMTSLPPLLGTVMSVAKSLSGRMYTSNTILLAGHETTDMVIMNTASVSVDRYVSGSIKSWTFTVESQTANILFIARSDSGNGVLKLDISGTNYVTLASTAGVCNGDILEFGIYPYIGFFRSDVAGVPFQVFTKQSLVSAASLFGGVSSSGYVGYTLTTGPSTANSFMLSFQSNAGWNLHSAFLQFDQCSNRDGATQVCSVCNPGYYLDNNSPGNTCLLEFRGNVASGSSKVKPCQVSNCLDCADDISVCRKCAVSPTKYYLYTGTCVTGGAPAGYGVDLADTRFISCSDQHCLNCAVKNTECTACEPTGGWYLYPQTHTCIQKASFPPKSGIDLSGLTVKGCADTNCKECSENYLLCQKCDSEVNFRLSANKCRTAIELTTVLIESSLSVALVHVKAATPVDTELENRLYSELLDKATFTISTRSSNNDHLISKDSIAHKKMMKEGKLLLEISFLSPLYKPSYIVSLALDNSVEFSEASQDYMGWSSDQTLLIQPPVSDEQSTFTTLVSNANTDSTVGSAVVLSAMALDPTGTVFRFTKILQVINKLYYINVNFGANLEHFLIQTAATVQESPEFQNAHSLHFRGKLSRNRVPLSTLHPSLFWKSLAYWITWALKLGLYARRTFSNDGGARKWLLYLCYNANRLHVLVFNLIYADYIWIAARTLLHSKSLGPLAAISARLTAMLLCLDLILILRNLLETWRWVYLDKILKPSYIKADSHVEGSPPSFRDLPKQKREIDYERTYQDIDFNVHLMEMFSATQTLTTEAMSSKLVKTLTLGLWVRPIVLQLAISSTQNLQKFGLCVFLGQELVRLVATISAYIKFRHLNNVVSFLAEISQGLFMITFSLLSLKFSLNSKSEVPSETDQTAGIWIVICSCAAEYLLLASFLVILLVRYIKEKLRIKRLGLIEKPNSFIKYLKSSREGTSPTMTKASPAKVVGTPISFARLQSKHLMIMTPLQPPGSMRIAKVNQAYPPESANSTERDLPSKRGSSNFVKVYESPYVKISAASVVSIADKREKMTPKLYLMSQRGPLAKYQHLQYC